MSLSQDSGTVIVCREVFDESSHPSNEEVLDYARRVGIDPETEPYLLDLAREGLMAPLPKGWTPCLDETTGAWYYYQASTKTATWEHPLDAKNRALVEKARANAGNRRQSLDDESKTTAREIDSQEEVNSEKNSKIVLPVSTRIPTKLAPLRKSSLESILRKRTDGSQERTSKKSESPVNESWKNSGSSMMTDRASRDYTNVVFQDPKFYETPRLLDSVDGEQKLKEIVKRSESMSPRYEKDWEQLSSKFSSEENVIDIDKLSASSLARSEQSKNSGDKFDKEKHPRNLSQKELTLSGGGSMFLKSNRSREATPSQESGKMEDFGKLNENPNFGEKPKSILREKPAEIEERGTDEERKSVRFDLEKGPEDIKFTFTSFEDEIEDNPENSDISESDETGGLKKSESCYSGLRKLESQSRFGKKGNSWILGFDSMLRQYERERSNEDESEDKDETGKDDEKEKDSKEVKFHIESEPEEGTSSKEDADDRSKEKRDNENSSESKDSGSKKKIVARRFVVENVSEKEHLSQLSQLSRDDSVEVDFLPKNKFFNIKNIDLFSRSETESRSSLQDEARSSVLEDIRRSKEAMLENMRRTDKATKDKSNLDFEISKLSLTKEQEKELEMYKKELESDLEVVKRGMEENLNKERKKLEVEIEERLQEIRKDLAKKEKQEIEKLVAEMDELRMENLKKVRNELEICYEKERQDILENLKTELDQRKRELLELRNQEMEKLQKEHETELAEDKIIKLAELEMGKQQQEKIDEMKKQLEKEFDDLRNELRQEQREKVTKITEDHAKCLAEILRDFKRDESLARKVYKQRLEEIRADFSKDTDKETKKQAERATRQETVDFEKIRCEKRLLEDKYRTLKDKYSKLKNDVWLAVEKRRKRKEGNATTTSETEKSTSARTRTERTDPSDQKGSPGNSSSNVSARHHQIGETSQTKSQENSECGQSSSGFARTSCHADSSRSSVKFESDDATTASETVNSNAPKNRRKSFARRSSSSVKSHNNNNNGTPDNPVENIRKQLEKLEDLGDQLPSDESAYTLRYPFQDKAPANASSELEFLRHRIHVERDSVKRAREALRVQRSAFQSRQRALKQKSVRATLVQLVQEERELSDMEVSLHRTRSLLGEKVICLKHLEQSLERVANAKRSETESVPSKNDEITLSDMSSASSGFSSTDLGTDTFIDKPDHYQESTEIIASLENLNSEIREIWGVLNKRQDNNIPPPPTIMYSDLGWLPLQHLTTQSSNVQGFGTPNIQSNILSQLTHPPTTTTQNIIAQYGPNSGFTTSVGTVERGASSLIERTRHMRDWLRQARMESTDLISPGQATL